MDADRVFPLTAKAFPRTLSINSRVSLSRTCKFAPEELICNYGLKVDGILHVGAHKGEEIEGYIRAGVKKAVFIEPLMQNYLELEKKVKPYVGYSALRIAAGDENKTIRINLASNDLQSSSILEPFLHLTQNPEIRFFGSEEVELKRIDSLDNIPRLNFWVIDVQGYELQVLKGSSERIEECDYLFIEINRAEVYQNCTKIKDLDCHLSLLGFTRVVYRWWSLWGDALYVRKNKLPLEL